LHEYSATSQGTASERAHEYSAGDEVVWETGLRFPSGHCCEIVSVTQMSVRFYGKQLKLLMAKNSIQL